MRINTEIEKRAHRRWCEEQFVKKDVYKVTMETIKQDIQEIKDAIKKLADAP